MQGIEFYREGFNLRVLMMTPWKERQHKLLILTFKDATFPPWWFRRSFRYVARSQEYGEGVEPQALQHPQDMQALTSSSVSLDASRHLDEDTDSDSIEIIVESRRMDFSQHLHVM